MPEPLHRYQKVEDPMRVITIARIAGDSEKLGSDAGLADKTILYASLEQIYNNKDIDPETMEAIEYVVGIKHEEKLAAKGGLVALGIHVSHVNNIAAEWLEPVQEWANKVLRTLGVNPQNTH